jgi:hypothetical protein
MLKALFIVLTALFQLTRVDGQAEVESRLTSDGASACETCFQLDALFFNVDITIENVARPGDILGFNSNTPAGDKARNQIRLRLLVTQPPWVYKARFKRIKDNASLAKVICSSRHFWLAVKNSPDL